MDGCFTFISGQGNSVIHYYVVSSDFVSKSDMHFEVGSREETNHMLLNSSQNQKSVSNEQKEKA